MFKPIIIGGQDITSLRATFDYDDKRIIVPSNRQLIYYEIKSGHQDGVANISPERLQKNEIIVACERVDMSLYLFTNYGKIFIWNLETRDWINELSLPIDTETETLLSCRMLNKRQYVYSTKNIDTKQVKLLYSMSRSEREKPKQFEFISEITNGDETSFDIGSCMKESDSMDPNKKNRERLSKQRVLTFIHGKRVYFQRVGLGEKLQIQLVHQTLDLDFTCVRANPKFPMIAAGDSIGRIFLYTSEFSKSDRWANRTKLHWHRNTVNDLCFSSTGHTLYSAGSESGCIVIWELATNTIGQKKVVPALGMPIRHINCSPNMSFIVLSFEDNEIQFMDTDNFTIPMKTITRRTYDMYLKNNYRAMRFGSSNEIKSSDTIPCDVENASAGLLWHPKSDSLVTNSKTGKLQFYSLKQRATTEILDCLKSSVLTLEEDGRVIPSEITKAALSLDGDWLAFFETRHSIDGLFPEVRLHIWQRSSTFSKWFWIQTADRLHSTANITDLKFSPDGRYLVSVGEDGTFHVLHRVNLDTKSAGKQMYAKGFFGNVPEGLPSLAAFSQDSSVLAISLKNESTLIWMIVDPFKLEYECQLNREDSEDIEQLPLEGKDAGDEDKLISNRLRSVLGLHFGRHEPSRSIAPLCEVRSRYIRIWNILNAQSSSAEMMEYLATDGQGQTSHGENNNNNNNDDGSDADEFTAAAFDHCIGNDQVLEHFAVSTKKNLIHLFELKINQDSRKLQPLIVIDGYLAQINNREYPRHYNYMCFVGNPIMEIDENSHQDPLVVKLINRLCLMTNEQELVSFTDKLTVERELAINSCNAVKTYELGEVQEYFTKSKSLYQDELKDMSLNDTSPSKFASITRKQRRIKQRLEVQRMLKGLFERIPSHNLPRIELLGPMILDKLVIE